MCAMQVGTLMPERSHKYFELKLFQFYSMVTLRDATHLLTQRMSVDPEDK